MKTLNPSRAAVLGSLALLLALPAAAQTAMPAMPGMDHAAHGAGGPAMAGYMASMDSMMDAMGGIAASGNADADFLLMMIPHHRSAIDMARVELEHGKDPKTREMASRIIAAQEGEIAEMKAMLRDLGVDPGQ